MVGLTDPISFLRIPLQGSLSGLSFFYAFRISKGPKYKLLRIKVLF